MSLTVEIRQAKTQAELHQVYQLTHDTFVDKNLCQIQDDRLLKNNLELDTHKETYILLASMYGEIRGSLSITVHRKVEEVYNYPFFSSLLDKHYNHHQASYSGWRLVSKGNLLEKILIAFRLILAGQELGSSLGIKQAYFSFVPEQIKFYKSVFPSAKILGRVHKKTDLISGDLYLVKYIPDNTSYHHILSQFHRTRQKLERYNNR